MTRVRVNVCLYNVCESRRIWAVKYRDQRNTQLTLCLVFKETIITHVSLLNIKPEPNPFPVFLRSKNPEIYADIQCY